jgi:hypothetical protein
MGTRNRVGIGLSYTDPPENIGWRAGTTRFLAPIDGSNITARRWRGIFKGLSQDGGETPQASWELLKTPIRPPVCC